MLLKMIAKIFNRSHKFLTSGKVVKFASGSIEFSTKILDSLPYGNYGVQPRIPVNVEVLRRIGFDAAVSCKRRQYNLKKEVIVLGFALK